MMPEKIIFCCYLLHPKQIRAYRSIVFRVKQVDFLWVKTCLGVWKNKILILLHREQKLPTDSLVIITVYYGQMLYCARRGLIKRHDMFLQVAFSIAEDGYMVVIARAYIVGRLFVAISVKYQTTKIVAFVVQCHGIVHASYRYALYTNALFLVKPYRVFVKIGECCLGVTSILTQPLLKYLAHPRVYHLVHLQILVHLFALGEYCFKCHCF